MNSTLVKSLRVLEALVLSETARGISELARDIKLDKSAVQRIFQTLVAEGYIEKETTSSNYKPTLRLWELGSRVISGNEMRRLLRPILRYAAKTTGITAYFAKADFPDIIYLDKVEGERGRPNSSDPGRRIPMHLAASGRAILAFLDQDNLSQVYRSVLEEEDMGEQYCSQLKDDLDRIRKRFYACTERVSATRINSIASPVWENCKDIPSGSVVLTSDSVTLPSADFESFGHLAISLGEQATRVLGGRYPLSIGEAP